MREVHILHTHNTHTHAQVIMHLLLVSVGKCVLLSYLMPTLAVVIVLCPTKVFSCFLATKVITTWIGMPSLATYLTVWLENKVKTSHSRVRSD